MAGEISLSSLTPTSWSTLERGGGTGFCVAYEAQKFSRPSKYGIETQLEDERIARLKSFFADPSYISAELGFGRLNDVLVDCQYGLCMTSDGCVLEETAYMPKLIDGAIEGIPFLNRSGTNLEYEKIQSPVLHCFHRSTTAYGYFIFDALAAVMLCRDAIVSGHLNLLMPGFLPKWIKLILARVGIPQEYIISPPSKVVLCAEVVVPNLMDCRHTFKPNSDVCLQIASIGAPRPGDPRHQGSHIYVSRRNQRSYNDRLLENERQVEQVLAGKGYTIVKPGKLSFAAQAAIFRKARVIVGAHGSAFGNLVFARPGTVVIDLMPLDWIGFRDSVGTRERWLLNVTTALNLDYTVIVCPSRLINDPARTKHGKRPIAYSAPINLLSAVAPHGTFLNRLRATATQWARSRNPTSAR